MALKLDLFNSNSDWTKRYSWDIPATNADELKAFLADHGMTPNDFAKLPVYRAGVMLFPWVTTVVGPQASIAQDKVPV